MKIFSNPALKNIVKKSGAVIGMLALIFSLLGFTTVRYARADDVEIAPVAPVVSPASDPAPADESSDVTNEDSPSDEPTDSTTPTLTESISTTNAQTLPSSTDTTDTKDLDTGSISGKIYNDSDGSGEINDQDSGLSDWNVDITPIDPPSEDTSASYDTHTTTSSEGEYLFDGIPTQTYKVCETLPSGWHQTYPTLDTLYGVECDNGTIGYQVLVTPTGSPIHTNIVSPLNTDFANTEDNENPELQSCTTVSDTSTQVDGHDAVAITPHPAWTSIEGATWISSQDLDQNGSSPIGTEVYTKDFNITGSTTDATLEIAADNYYSVKVNGNTIDTGSSATTIDNYSSTHTWTIPASDLIIGTNVIEFTVTNPGTNPDNGQPYGDPNPSGLLFKLSTNSASCEAVTPPPSTTGTINVHKVTDPANTDQDFTFNLTSRATPFNGSRVRTTTANAAGSDGQFSNLHPGMFNLAEATTSAWNLTGIDCRYENNDREDGLTLNDDMSETIVVQSGDIVDCTFTNTIATSTGTSTTTSGGSHHISAGGGAGGSDNDNNDQGQVLGASTGPDDSTALSCPAYLTQYIKYGSNNDLAQVVRLQVFLNELYHAGLPITGFYDPLSFQAAKNFQVAESQYVRDPWAEAGVPITDAEWPTGYVYKTTEWRINSIVCGDGSFSKPLLP